ncbi:MAG: 7-cyano-7-deazaguanine synthase QueC [Nitrospirae bacterium]|nr:7-cyano-7-deazaguanine synthase QueC [Nitrospirota bacterium]
MKRAIVLSSGGIDSTTAMAIAKAEGYEVYSLSFNYGQRHKIELEQAKKIADYFGAKKHIIIDIDLRKFGGSALTADIDVPKDRQIDDMTNEIPVTYVPARNTIFLSFALAWAEVVNADSIFIGVNAIDYSGYPDCRPEYIKAFENMANLATKAGVEGKIRFKIKTPLINMTKADIIKKGAELGVDYSLTWSCYDPQPTMLPFSSELQTPNSKLIPCGRCDSCLLRKKGFIEAGVKDPTRYKK